MDTVILDVVRNILPYNIIFLYFIVVCIIDLFIILFIAITLRLSVTLNHVTNLI